ncbi:HlyD family efflux transporter periplasmic adaptor subunit [Roseospira marina]|uniref:HlyD family efflux transporter periplasmic adaptor subunit n=1 Tax=Roseospira marina TaxID=140057 RepID=A0A5M6I6C6_9PROT|nr:HlyD family efflux transporter periplasmic adaptor subunit [Roseospira marina]KAA5603800.1 HlyD family efflux transporter periplasmic adaptor subunit [Roseospira marina]MBB4316009.1 membrane fusion protein (multidrug efflux system) [Roseospira marina]MBB5089175.1 membrane fusion protein (multidrug efflux system) [Roseospira marina]
MSSGPSQPSAPPPDALPPNAPAPSPPQPARKRRRTLGLILAVLAFAAAGGGYWVYWTQIGRFHIETENAYVAGNRIHLTPQVSGTIRAVHVDDTDRVMAGDTLVVLDDTDARVALDKAKAALAQTVREVRHLFAQPRVLAATIAVREAALERARDDLDSHTYLARTGAGSKETLRHTGNDVKQAEAALAAAREDLAAARVLVDRTTVTQHPRVRLAAAEVRAAYLDWRRTQVLAPVSGQVAQRSAQVGQRTTPATPLLAIVPMDDLWVDANFKEAQLRDVRIGQPVDLIADLYGNDVHFAGQVVGLSAGTGSAFSLLPAQNATGNWIKVVQRVPVRIALDPGTFADHPLRVGLSMRVSIDLRDRSGSQLAPVRPTAPVAETSVYAGLDRDACALVERLIAETLAAADPPDGPDTPPVEAAPSY